LKEKIKKKPEPGPSLYPVGIPGQKAALQFKASKSGLRENALRNLLSAA